MVTDAEVEAQAFGISGVNGVAVQQSSVIIYVETEAALKRLPNSISGRRVIGKVIGPVFTRKS